MPVRNPQAPKNRWSYDQETGALYSPVHHDAEHAKAAAKKFRELTDGAKCKIVFDEDGRSFAVSGLSWEMCSASLGPTEDAKTHNGRQLYLIEPPPVDLDAQDSTPETELPAETLKLQAGRGRRR